MRIAFLGTPDFAVPSLEALEAAGHELAAVYTQPPRPAGRGQGKRKSPVHVCADRFGLVARTPASLKDPAAQAAFAGLGLDLAVVVAYGQILPKTILDAPRLGCLNLHASLLPRWRGAAPIQRAIMAGDTVTGVQVMAMDEGLDTGAILFSETTPIAPSDTAGSLHDRLAGIGAALMVRALVALEVGEVEETPQSEDGVTTAKKITKSEARIDWARPAVDVDRLIRGLSPFPGAWFELAARDQNVRVKALNSRAEKDVKATGAPGEVLDEALLVACGSGAIRLTQLQREGRKVQNAEDFLRGARLGVGDTLS